jgi:hypothetical protein
VKFRWGFKTEAERIAAEARKELGLNPTDRLDLMKLADQWGIPVHSFHKLAEFGLKADSLQCLCGGEDDPLSGITLFDKHRRFIFINDRRAKTRQASDLAHELGHCLLEHEPQALDNGEGQRLWNREMEEEATWLGAALLIPAEGAFDLMRNNLTIDQLASHYGVSNKYCEMRVYAGGIKAHVDRWAARREKWSSRAGSPKR